MEEKNKTAGKTARVVLNLRPEQAQQLKNILKNLQILLCDEKKIEFVKNLTERLEKTLTKQKEQGKW